MNGYKAFERDELGLTVIQHPARATSAYPRLKGGKSKRHGM
jgi:hypothetical protein